MTATEGLESTFIVLDGHAVIVVVDTRGAPSFLGVTVSVDGHESRSSEEPGWRSIRYGVSGGDFYWWSARQATLLHLDRPTSVEAIETSEDIVVAFRRHGNWLLACETSLRLFRGQEEVSKLDYGHVIERAIIEGDHVRLWDESGTQSQAGLSSDHLTALPGAE